MILAGDVASLCAIVNARLIVSSVAIPEMGIKNDQLPD